MRAPITALTATRRAPTAPIPGAAACPAIARAVSMIPPAGGTTATGKGVIGRARRPAFSFRRRHQLAAAGFAAPAERIDGAAGRAARLPLAGDMIAGAAAPGRIARRRQRLHVPALGLGEILMLLLLDLGEAAIGTRLGRDGELGGVCIMAPCFAP